MTPAPDVSEPETVPPVEAKEEIITQTEEETVAVPKKEPKKYTCVHHRMGRVLYGVLVGVVSMGFRYYGVYETGVCFALLAVNSVSAWIDRTEAKLYHLTHLQADAGKGAACSLVKCPCEFTLSRFAR